MDIKRYDVGGDYGYGYCDEEEQGQWVLFDDHCAVLASLQSELIKAREALKLIEDHSDDEVARTVAYEAGTKQMLGQSAPAAKCSNCGQAEKGQTGEYPCTGCGVPLTHDAPAVLPRALSLDRKVNNINYNQGWNACIEEFERLNK